MKQSIFYCKSWFRAEKRPTEIWTEEQAKTAHLSKKLYTVLVNSIEKPFCFLEINKGFVGVGFLDDMARESLYYAFKEIEPGKLFLSMATHREFDGDTDTIIVGTTYIFDPSGLAKIQKQHFKPRNMEVANSSVDVASNYSHWPEFGEYDDLIRIERGA
jgi:hypothetical protein